MLDPQDLEAISMLLDKKLDPIRSDIAELKQDVSGLKQDVSGLKQDVSGLKQEVSGLKQEVASLNERVTALELGQKRIESKLENEIDQCIKIMGEAYSGTVQKINDLNVDTLRAKVDSLDIAYRFMRMEIKDLKGIPQSA
jgi:predicted  nucleic acid-binding Zn-ribbon protein